MSRVRVQLDLKVNEAKALDALRDRCDLRSRTDAVKAALGILEWVEGQAAAGRRIVSVGDQGISQLVVPGITIGHNGQG